MHKVQQSIQAAATMSNSSSKIKSTTIKIINLKTFKNLHLHLQPFSIKTKLYTYLEQQ